MVSTLAGLYGNGSLDNQVHTDGLTELARILKSLDAAATCATAYVGDCASNFCQFAASYVVGRRLALPYTFSSGNPCINAAETDRKLRRTCAYECKTDAARCKDHGVGPRTCAPRPPPLADVFVSPTGGRFKRLARERGLDRRPDDY